VLEANSQKGALFLHILYRNVIRWKHVKFFIMSCKSISHCKSFEVIWF